MNKFKTIQVLAVLSLFVLSFGMTTRSASGCEAMKQDQSAGLATLAAHVPPAQATGVTAPVRETIARVVADQAKGAVPAMTPVPQFQGQCSTHSDCGVGWRCCSTSCENVDVCP